MNATQLRALFPNISADVLRRSVTDPGQVALLDNDPGPVAELERHSGDGAVGEVQIQKGIGRQFFVRVKSYRKRLLDQDNLCEKYLVDLLRYSGVLPGDSPATTKIEVCQEKVGSKEPERTVVEVFEA